MSTKRILGITLFGVVFIGVVIGIMLLTSYLRREREIVVLPDVSASVETPGETQPDTLDRIEVTTETIQAVVSTLSRPAVYRRDIAIESFWDAGRAEYSISVSVSGDLTSLRSIPPAGIEKRIIITPDTLYIWYRGDKTPYTGPVSGAGDGNKTADEWQMLVTYEDVIGMDKGNIIDAGYIEYGGEDCVYVEYLSPLLGNKTICYISLELGLVTGAEEYDGTGKRIYAMTAGNCLIGEVDSAAFILPDGTDLGVS